VTRPSPSLHLKHFFTRHTRPQFKCHTIATFKGIDTIVMRVSGVYSWAKCGSLGSQIFIGIVWYIISRLALGPAQPSIRSVLELLLLGYTVGDVNLTTLVLKLRIVEIHRDAGKFLALPIFLFAAQPKELYLDGLNRLEQRSHKCVELKGGIYRVNTFFQSRSLFFSLQSQRIISPLRTSTHPCICMA
jgi:hypothetical protein